jgi:hypothetical protein
LTSFADFCFLTVRACLSKIFGQFLDLQY